MKSYILKNCELEKEFVEIVLTSLKQKNATLRKNLEAINEAIFIDSKRSVLGESDIFEYLFEYAIEDFILTLQLKQSLRFLDFEIDKDNFMKLLKYHRVGYQILRQIKILLLYKETDAVDMDLIAKMCSFTIIDSYLNFALDKEDYSFLKKSIGGEE